jgi:hypothetical protein
MNRVDINLYKHSKGESISFSAVADDSSNLSSQGAYEKEVLPIILSDFLKKSELKEIYLRSMPPTNPSFIKLDKGLLTQIGNSLKEKGIVAKIILC